LKPGFEAACEVAESSNIAAIVLIRRCCELATEGLTSAAVDGLATLPANELHLATLPAAAVDLASSPAAEVHLAPLPAAELHLTSLLCHELSLAELLGAGVDFARLLTDALNLAGLFGVGVNLALLLNAAQFPDEVAVLVQAVDFVALEVEYGFVLVVDST